MGSGSGAEPRPSWWSTGQTNMVQERKLVLVLMVSPLVPLRYPGILRSDLIGQSEVGGAFQRGGARHPHQPVGFLQPPEPDRNL